MYKMKFLISFLLAALLLIGGFAFTISNSTDDNFVVYQVNPKKQDFKLYWKDDKGQTFKSLQNLKTWLEGRKQILLFAMNAGMYKVDNTPLGLYIENKKIVSPLNARTASGNFYWKPNGVLYIDTENNAA